MPTTTTTVALREERRRFLRNEPPAPFDVSLLQPNGLLPADSVNVSESGLCLRLQERLEVHSLVRLQLTSGRTASIRHVECAGRVAWIMQRLDLRQQPPFLFDVGIELIKPPLIWRQSLAQRGALPVSPAHRAVRKGLEAVTIRNRRYVPALEHVPTQALRWHVVVSVDGIPCFSGRYASERAALAAWATFKRQQAKR